ncbi:MAG: hypothetical protein JNL70_22630 [Saprospiraceae bacterium]|nr:hypothetical protein [Saprospiraceae bacterium]
MKQKGSCLFYIIGFLLVIVGLGYCKYCGSYGMDLLQRPWAYSTDKNAKLFVGKWEGSFKDPDSVSKKIEVEIFLPTTDDERWNKAFRKTRRRSVGTHESKRSFDGRATVTSPLGTENYEIWGSFENTDFRQFSFQVVTEKNLPVANFYIQGAKPGVWEGDKINMTTAFNYRKADGTGFYQSSDPRFEQKASFTVKRK